jgi:hypothetical protein
VTELSTGRHEHRGRHERVGLWCLTHNRPSPYSTTYCHMRWQEWREQPCRIIDIDPVPLCCGGAMSCRLNQLDAMTRAQLTDAVIEAEEGLGMANAYIGELRAGVGGDAAEVLRWARSPQFVLRGPDADHARASWRFPRRIP